MVSMRRRDMLMSLPLALSGVAAFTPSLHAATSRSPASLWNIADLGAVADGKTNNTAVIQQALDKAALSGGIVYVPPGTFVTGTLTLGSNTILHLEAGAVLLASPHPQDYAVTRGKLRSGTYLLAANQADNCAITGAGVIDGNCAAFRRPSHREQFAADKQWLDVAIFDWQTTAPFEALLHFTGCTNVTLRDFTIRECPRWNVFFDACDTVAVEGIRIRNVNFVPETDGIDINCSRNVIIRGCDIATADDAICIKSYGDGDVPPTSNILVTGCLLTGCCNGFKIGTGSKGRIEDIQFTDSIIYNTAAQSLKERLLGAICIEMVDGGTLDGVKVSGIQVRNARAPIFIRLAQRSGGPGTLRNVSIEDVDAYGGVCASSITGLPGNAVQDVSLRNLRLHSDEGGPESWSHIAVPELADHYPEALMFERLPAYGLYARHVNGLQIANVETIAAKGDGRPALLIDDVRNLDLSALRATAPVSTQPVLALNNCRRAFLHGLQAPEGTRTYLRVTGTDTDHIRLVGNDLSDAGNSIEADDMNKVKTV